MYPDLKDIPINCTILTMHFCIFDDWTGLLDQLDQSCFPISSWLLIRTFAIG